MKNNKARKLRLLDIKFNKTNRPMKQTECRNKFTSTNRPKEQHGPQTDFHLHASYITEVTTQRNGKRMVFQ